MKKFRIFSLRRFFVTAILLCTVSVRSQVDTLHLNYHHTHAAPHDSTVAKIEKWAKALNGQHVDVRVVAYFHKPEFKKYADQRVEELFLVLNRKARDLITIESMTSKKGKDFQRTMVDIIYTKTMSQEEKDKAAAAKKAEEEKKKEAEREQAAAKKAAAEKEKEKSGAAEKKDVAKEKGGETESGDKGNKGKTESSSKSGKKESAKSEEDPVAREEAIASQSSKYPARRNVYKLGVNEEELNLIKNGQIIVCGTHSDHNDRLLLNAVKKHWKVNSNFRVMPYDSASELAKKDKNVILMFITRIKTEELSGKKTSVGNFGPVNLSLEQKNKAISDAVVLERGKKKVMFTSFFPRMKEEPYIRQEMVDFAVSVANSTFTRMSEQGMKKIRTVNAPFEKYSESLRERPLLIPDLYLSSKVPHAEVSNYYHGKFQVVDYKTYADAILSQKPFAYVVPAPVSIGGDIKTYDYIVDAESGHVYYIAQAPVLNVPKIRGPVGSGVDISHSERITSKNLEKYNKAFEKKGKGEEDEEVKTEDQSSESGNTEKPASKKPKEEKDKKEKSKEKKAPEKKKSKSEKSAESDSTETK